MKRSAAAWQALVAGAAAAVGVSFFLQLMRRLGLRAKSGLTPYGTPLPRVAHRRLEPVKPGRLIVVGDLHGTPELFTLLERLSFRPSHDNLVLVGDLVNKGPASLRLLEALPGLGAVAVRGNHDDAALAAWLAWRQKGQPLPSKFEWSRDMSPAQADLLAQLPFTLAVPQYGVAVVHAGLVPGVPLEQQELWACYKMRNLVPHPHGDGGGGGGGTSGSCSADPATATSASTSTSTSAGTPTATASSTGTGQAPAARYTAVEKAKEGGQAWAPLWPGAEPPAQHVFFGHDAKRRLQLAPHATGLDTGCVYGGELTAAVLPPLEELVASSPGFVAAMRHGRPLTREDLRVQLFSVPAARVYSAPDGHADTAAAGVATAAAVGASAGSGSGNSSGRMMKEAGRVGAASGAGVELVHPALR